MSKKLYSTNYKVQLQVSETETQDFDLFDYFQRYFGDQVKAYMLPEEISKGSEFFLYDAGFMKQNARGKNKLLVVDYGDHGLYVFADAMTFKKMVENERKKLYGADNSMDYSSITRELIELSKNLSAAVLDKSTHMSKEKFKNMLIENQYEEVINSIEKEYATKTDEVDHDMGLKMRVLARNLPKMFESERRKKLASLSPEKQKEFIEEQVCGLPENEIKSAFLMGISYGFWLNNKNAEGVSNIKGVEAVEKLGTSIKNIEQLSMNKSEKENDYLLQSFFVGMAFVDQDSHKLSEKGEFLKRVEKNLTLNYAQLDWFITGLSGSALMELRKRAEYLTEYDGKFNPDVKLKSPGKKFI